MSYVAFICVFWDQTCNNHFTARAIQFLPKFCCFIVCYKLLFSTQQGIKSLLFVHRHTTCVHYFFNHFFLCVCGKYYLNQYSEWKIWNFCFPGYFLKLLIQMCRYYVMYQFVLNTVYCIDPLLTIDSLAIAEYIWLIFPKGHGQIRSQHIAKCLISILWLPCIKTPKDPFFRGPCSAFSFMILYCYGNCDITQQTADLFQFGLILFLATCMP